MASIFNEQEDINMSKTFIWIPESEWAMAPGLTVSAKPTERRDTFEISISHPNTRVVLFNQRIKAKSFDEALKKAKDIKKEQMAGIATFYEEVKIIPRPKKGKMELKFKK
jgi:uncharacterized protein YktB (UPF0637 family)